MGEKIKIPDVFFPSLFTNTVLSDQVCFSYITFFLISHFVCIPQKIKTSAVRKKPSMTNATENMKWIISFLCTYIYR